jgi:YfiH family protein
VVSAIDVENGAAAVRPEADAVISDVADAVLAVQVADCVPMLMADDRLGVAGAVHAGWRGTCAGIAAAAVGALAREFGSRAGDLQVAVGPSIGACCYEVGGEVLDAFRSAGAGDRDLARWFTRTSTGSLRLDLWTANCDQLVAAGVPREHVHLSRLCTRTHAEVFDSYRAHGAGAGRMVAAIRVPPRADRTDSTATEDAHRAARP